MESSWKRLSLAAVLSIMGLLATEIWYQNQSVSSLQTTAETAIAFISKSYDEISRRPTGKSNFVLINSGDLVFSGDTIATGPRGEIRIQFNNGERFLDLEPESMILIEDSNEETSLSLLSGSLFVTSNSEEGKSITLQNGNSKVDLSKATAQISKGSNNKIDLQVIKGRAILKKEGSDDIKEITSGKSASVSEAGVAQQMASLQILSPSLDKPHFTDGEYILPIHFQWSGAPAGSVSHFYIGSNKNRLTEIPLQNEKQNELNQFLNPGKYYWKILAKDPTGRTIAESPLQRTEVIEKMAPKIISPLDNHQWTKEAKDQNFTFRWIRPEGLIQSRMEIFKINNGQEKVLDKSFSHEDNFSLNLPSGKYQWKLSGKYNEVPYEIPGKINFFSISEKTIDQKVNLKISWVTPTANSIFYVDQPTASLSWAADQKVPIYQWRLKIADRPENLASAPPLLTKSPSAKTTLSKPGRYVASVEALGKDQQVLGVSNYKTFELNPMPLLRAPQVLPVDGHLLAERNGTYDMQWEEIKGAQKYVTILFDSSGKELRRETFAASRTTLNNLLPGYYKIAVQAIDEHGRMGDMGTPRELSVPDSSGLEAPRIKGIRIKK